MQINAMTELQGLIKQNKEKALKKSVNEFAAYFFYQIFKEMWDSIPKSGLMPETSAEKMYRDMLLYEYSKKMMDVQMKPLSDMIYKSLAKGAYGSGR